MRRTAFLTRILLLAFLAAAPASRADETQVLQANLRAAEEGLVLDADFAFDLTPRLTEVLSSGVPLYFVVDFNLERRRWYWFDERAIAARLQMRVSYHPLSRHFRMSTGLLQRNFESLDEVLAAVKRVRNWLVADRSTTFSNADYEASIRLRLDTSLLPKPFQLSALTARDLQLETPWKRFTVAAPRHLPAPVETREPKGAGAAR